jgi:hypothetical protein
MAQPARRRHRDRDSHFHRGPDGERAVAQDASAVLRAASAEIRERDPPEPDAQCFLRIDRAPVRIKSMAMPRPTMRGGRCVPA